MRAIIVMFDSLNRRMLPPYGDTSTHAPNFARLADKTVTFDTCYAGSMPCMPARREMHTGRYNFLHRSWSPLEPFDDSMPEMLKTAGVYTHLITDHQHYWEDGGATFHNRYASYEFFRGQEGDLWKGEVGKTDPAKIANLGYRMGNQDRINRSHLTDEADHPQTGVFEAGLSFIETNADADNWMVQIETFDPHEPFFSYARHQARYADPPGGNHGFDWPPYARVTEDAETEEIARNRYLALLSMCDENLGRVLDLMDARDMWQDTMLIVCTDHGYMLGEKGWWAKSVMPWYDETIHTPLFVWDPRAQAAGERRSALVQTIDIAPTLLDFFELKPTKDMQGKPLRPVLADDTPLRKGGLFGSHGGHVSVTDGRYVYMRASATPENAPLNEYTLMPMHMRSMMSPAELRDAQLVPPLSFTKETPVLCLPAWNASRPWDHGTLLFDLETDPGQAQPLTDEKLELRMAQLLVDFMRASDAPPEQYERLGLPEAGDVTTDHLLCATQAEQARRAALPAVRSDAFPAGAVIRSAPISHLLSNPAQAKALSATLPILQNDNIRRYLSEKTVIEIAGLQPGVQKEDLERLETALRPAN